MSDHEVLAGLDRVPWARLEHAYGSAEDVPKLLPALRSPSPQDREHAMYELYGNIFHQGSRYEATAYAVPFLARLALDPATPQREAIVHLLSALAIGYDESHLPGGVDIAAWRDSVERTRAASPAEMMREFDQWVEAAEDEGERQARQICQNAYDHELALRHSLGELAAYDAVRAEIPRLRALLTESDPSLRSAAAYLLGWFPEESAGSVAALEALLTFETVPAVLANAFVSAGLLSGTGLVPRLREHLGGFDPLLRWAAAAALARMDEADPQVIDALVAATVDPPEEAADGVHFLDGDVRSHSSLILTTLADRLPSRAVDAVLEGLARSSETGAFTMAATALRLAFPHGPLRPLPPFAELTERQQRVVRILAEMGPETWRWGNFMMTLAAWNLPGDQAGCRAYAGLAAPE